MFGMDGMIVLKSYVWGDVLEKAKEYHIKYGKDHEYNLCTFNRYDFKDLKK